MKRSLLLLLSICSLCSFGQVIPNAGFEQWASPNGYEDPVGWGTYNFMSVFGNPITATKTTDKYSGTYAIRMESKLVTNNPNPAIYPDTIHTIYSGTVTLPPVFGFAYTQRPEEIQMHYKYTPANGSVAGILAYLFKWNSTLHRRDTIAVAATYLAASSNYQTSTTPFIYSSASSPDTAVIFMSPIAVYTPQQIGSVLIADDVQFNISSSVKEVNSSEPKFIRLNQESFTISGLTEKAEVSIFSLDGKIVHRSTFTPNSLLHAELNAGVYVYSINTSKKQFKGKFSAID